MSERTPAAVPVIDLGPMLSGDSGGEQQVAARIGEAARATGFFYVRNHGVDPQLCTAMFAASQALFHGPDAIKQAVAFAGPAVNRGYLGVASERLEPGRQPDLKEAFNIGLELAADDPDLAAGRPFRHPNLWPGIAGFRMTALAYFDAMLTLGRTLHRAFALDLDLPADYFEDKLRKPMATLRLLHYPSGAAQDAGGQIGAGMHTDYGNLTLLATDAVGGLKLRHLSGEWIDAPSVTGAFICNIGDCLMRWTNDRYCSTPHKVETPPDRERFSIAFFVDPDPDALVSCLPSCVADGETPRYPDILAERYLLSRISPTVVTSAAGRPSN